MVEREAVAAVALGPDPRDELSVRGLATDPGDQLRKQGLGLRLEGACSVGAVGALDSEL